MIRFNSLFAGTIITLASLPSGTTEAFAQSGQYEGWHMGPGMMGEWGMGWFGGIFMIIFWILVLVGLVFVIRWLVQSTSKKGDTDQHRSQAMDILKERYARGEIDRAQFETMKRDLVEES